jgi:hypothetical protein
LNVAAVENIDAEFTMAVSVATAITCVGFALLVTTAKRAGIALSDALVVDVSFAELRQNRLWHD